MSSWRLRASAALASGGRVIRPPPKGLAWVSPAPQARNGSFGVQPLDPERGREGLESALCSRWPTTRRMGEDARGCVKTQTFNLRIESPSRFRQCKGESRCGRDRKKGNRKNNSPPCWLLSVFSHPRPNPAIAGARLRKRLAEDFPIAAGRFDPARHAWRASLDARGLIGRRPTDA